MAQLIGFNSGFPGGATAPHVPGFQFWATRRLPSMHGIGSALGGADTNLGGLATGIMRVDMASNAADQMVGKTARVQIANFDETFEFRTGVNPVAPGNVAVTIVTGDTATQVATALAAEIDSQLGLVMGAQAGFASSSVVQAVFVATTDPAFVPVMRLTLNTPGVPAGFEVVTQAVRGNYGDMLLRRAWKAFVSPGLGGGTGWVNWADADARNLTLGVLPVRGFFPRWVGPLTIYPSADDVAGG